MSSENEFVKTRCDGHAGTIILQRTSCFNALSRQLVCELTAAFHEMHQEFRARAVILAATGSHFCSGSDLREMSDTAKVDDASMQWHDDMVQLRDLFVTMLRFPKPIIAAVNGDALGGGAGLVLASDIAIAEKQARIGVPAPRRGLVAGVVAPLLTFRVSGSFAANILLTGKTLDAEEALQTGIFQELVADGLLWARAVEIVNLIARCAPESLAMTKRMLNETIGEHLIAQLSNGAALSATARTTEAAQEGITAFLEKRDPNWR